MATSADSVAKSADTVGEVADKVTELADSGKWITAIEAAGSLKKSERTIQRYAKSGKLRSKMDES
ncbi:MAG: hypothetical protein K2X81_27045, partial [Candidatus Obscuribacterales bacterium]|nr:hypothetical protein [Candidatus Obscuribacterales bacterium]